MKLLPAFVGTPETDRIYNVDALTLLAALPDKSVDAFITDLPYGTTACSWDEIIPFEPMWEQVKRTLKPRGAFVTTASQPFTSKLIMSNLAWFRHSWVWNKNNSAGFMLAHLRPFIVTEDIVVFGDSSINYFPIMETRGEPRVKAGYSTSLAYGITPSKSKSNIYYPKNLLEFSNAKQEGLHPTQKPVALYEYLIKTYTQIGDLVVDFCCGSGTTALAAQNTGRRYIAGDSDAGYVALARERLQNADPFRPSIVADGVQQLSLFEAVA